MSTLHVVGGGLAGMTVAWEAVQRIKARKRTGAESPFDRVVLYEAAGRLGGKAGSYNDVNGLTDKKKPVETTNAAHWSDHGYHLFPAWYDNVIGLMGEVGILYEQIVVEGEQFRTIPRTPTVNLFKRQQERPAPGMKRVRQGFVARCKRRLDGSRLPFSCDVSPTHHGTLVVGKKDSPLSMAVMVLTVPMLVSSRDGTLEKRSVETFLKRRFPIVGRLSHPVYKSLILKALSADLDQMSALALAKMFRRWTRPYRAIVKPAWSSLDGSLERAFIAPFGEALRRAGVDVRTNWQLDAVHLHDERPDQLEFIDREPQPVRPGDHVVFAVPPAHLARFGIPEVTPHAQRLATQSSQFAGVDVYFSDVITVPRQHFGFPIDPEEFGATAYDIQPIWDPGELAFQEPMVLQLVVPKVAQMGIGSEGEMVDFVRGRIGHLLPFTGTKWFVHLNENAPLSLANTGLEPTVRDLNKVKAVSIAGDFMDSSIGVPSMEAAVGNGRRVAARLFGEEQADPDVRWRFWMAVLAVIFWIVAYVLLIVVSPRLLWQGIVKAYRWFRDRLRGDRGNRAPGPPPAVSS